MMSGLNLNFNPHMIVSIEQTNTAQALFSERVTLTVCKCCVYIQMNITCWFCQIVTQTLKPVKINYQNNKV